MVLEFAPSPPRKSGKVDHITVSKSKLLPDLTTFVERVKTYSATVSSEEREKKVKSVRKSHDHYLEDLFGSDIAHGRE
jgi:hypothetical protein